MVNWRAKESHLPKTPHSMEEFLTQLQEAGLIQKYELNGEKFIHQIPSSCERAGKSVGLFSIAGLRASQGSTKALMDSTFKFYPQFIKQLFIVHAFVGKYVS